MFEGEFKKYQEEVKKFESSVRAYKREIRKYGREIQKWEKNLHATHKKIHNALKNNIFNEDKWLFSDLTMDILRLKAEGLKIGTISENLELPKEVVTILTDRVHHLFDYWLWHIIVQGEKTKFSDETNSQFAEIEKLLLKTKRITKEQTLEGRLAKIEKQRDEFKLRSAAAPVDAA